MFDNNILTFDFVFTIFSSASLSPFHPLLFSLMLIFPLSHLLFEATISVLTPQESGFIEMQWNCTEKAKLTNGLKFSNECKIKVNWISHWVLTETLWKEAPRWVSKMKNRACSKILITFYTLITASNNICSETQFYFFYLEVVHVLPIEQEGGVSIHLRIPTQLCRCYSLTHHRAGHHCKYAVFIFDLQL